MLRILLATFVSWTGLRLTEVALPLIALQQTGSVWATGLVAGSSGIALLTSPWWAARLRHRLTSGPALAAVLGVQALGYLIVAVAAALDSLTVVHLCLGGLVVGAATSVGGPATRAMLADLGDRIGPGVAVRALAWQDLAHRISMVASPPVAAWVVTQHGAMPLMWADTIAVLLAAVVVAGVGRYALRRGPAGGSAPGAGGPARPPRRRRRDRDGGGGLVLVVRVRARPGHPRRRDRPAGTAGRGRDGRLRHRFAGRIGDDPTGGDAAAAGADDGHRVDRAGRHVHVPAVGRRLPARPRPGLRRRWLRDSRSGSPH